MIMQIHDIKLIWTAISSSMGAFILEWIRLNQPNPELRIMYAKHGSKCILVSHDGKREQLSGRPSGLKNPADPPDREPT
jgi:hypothetical protein